MIIQNRRVLALSSLLVLSIGILAYTRLTMPEVPPPPVPPEVAYRLATLPAVALAPPGAREDATYEKPYTFSTDWFSHDIPVWRAVLERYRGRPEVSYLEIGLYEGRSALWMMEQILTHPTARLTGVDPFGDPGAALAAHGVTFHANLALSGLSKKASIIRGYSQEEMRKLPLRSFDIIYIDGSHHAADALEDALLARRLLKDEGLLIFDDYQWRLDDPASTRPKVAVDWFYTLFRHEYDVLESSYQAILKKKKA